MQSVFGSLTFRYISLGPIIIASITTILFIASLLYYQFVRKQSIVWKFGFLQLAFLPFLFGFGLFTSASRPDVIIFWSKVSYSGIALSVLAFNVFVREITGRTRRKESRNLGIIIVAMFLFFIWGPTSVLLGENIEFSPSRSYFTPDKGFLYPVFFGFMYAFLFHSYGGLLYSYYKGKIDRYLLRPVIIGVTLLIINYIHDGLAVFGVWEHGVQPWIGPILLVLSLIVYVARLFSEREIHLQEMLEKNLELKQQLNFDGLTGLYTRTYFLHILDHELKLKERHSLNHTLLFIDVDNFKAVNDTYGHTTGDKILAAIGNVLRCNTRSSDIPARYAGDEFILLLVGCGEVNARKVAIHVMKDFEDELRENFPDIREKRPTLSIGGFHSFFWPPKPADIVNRVDKIMYKAKAEGKNQIAF